MHSEVQILIALERQKERIEQFLSQAAVKKALARPSLRARLVAALRRLADRLEVGNEPALIHDHAHSH